MKRPYRVMLRCPTGERRLISNPLAWEAVMQTITWCFEDTLEDAQHTARDLNNGSGRGVRAWAEESV